MVKTFKVAGTTYRGANPVYHPIYKPGMPVQWVKTQPGIPWRRVNVI